MDGNKDEALKCLHIAKQSINSGDRPRALKFLSKARRLDPSLPLDDLLSAARDADPPRNSTTTPSPAPRTKPASSPSPSAGSSSSSSSRPYTDDQVAIVRQIKHQKDYYQILGLERSCTADDVRKAYRKLSLKVHPDKNMAPGADEAFKAVSRAFQCLSNDEARKKYDVTGSEEPNYGRPATRNHHAQGFNGFYEGDVDAEEIFRNFFFGGMGMSPATASFGRSGFRAGPSFHYQGSAGFNPRSLVSILPVIFLILVNVIPSFFPSSEPIYELHRSYYYQYKFETLRGVPYFVKSGSFEKDYPYGSPERIALEKRVEADYVGIVSQNCHVEMQQRRWGRTSQMPHCDMLQKYREAAQAVA